MAKENNPEIPTKEEIASLPRWAQVAFAARCARRVQPLFVHYWPDAPQQHIDYIDEAIRLAESSAANHAVSDTDIAANIATAVAYTAAEADIFPYGAAADAAAAASNALYASVNVSSSSAAYASSSSAASTSTSGAVSAGIWADFELLKELSQREKWDNETPVPPEVFGPMWPNGVSEGWPKLSDDGEQLYLKIELAVPQGMSEEESDEFNERTARFFAKLSAAHVAMGGTGLRIVEDASCAVEPILIEDNEPVGAGSSSDKEGWGQ